MPLFLLAMLLILWKKVPIGTFFTKLLRENKQGIQIAQITTVKFYLIGVEAMLVAT